MIHPLTSIARRLLPGLALLGVVLGGCCEAGRTTVKVRQHQQERTVERVEAIGEADAPKVDPVVADVNGLLIHLSQVERELSRARRLREQIGHPPSQSWLRSKRRRILHNLIDRQLLRKGLKDADIAITEAQIDARLDQRIQKTFLTRNGLERYLQKIGMDEAEYRQVLLDELAVEVLWGTEGSLNVTEDEARQHYKTRRESFKARSRARLAVIVLKIRPGMDARAMRDLETRAIQLSEQARRGADFAQLAREQSQGPTAASGGDLGWVYATNLDERIAMEAFKLPIGSVSAPIRTRLGYQIIKIHDRRPEGYRGYDEVHQSIHKQLLNRKRRKARQDLLLELKRQTPIRLYEDRLAPQKTRKLPAKKLKINSY